MKDLVPQSLSHAAAGVTFTTEPVFDSQTPRKTPAHSWWAKRPARKLLVGGGRVQGLHDFMGPLFMVPWEVRPELVEPPAHAQWEVGRVVAWLRSPRQHTRITPPPSEVTARPGVWPERDYGRAGAFSLCFHVGPGGKPGEKPGGKPGVPASLPRRLAKLPSYLDAQRLSP